MKIMSEHEKHIEGEYFQIGCNECAKFLGHAIMEGRDIFELKKKVRI